VSERLAGGWPVPVLAAGAALLGAVAAAGFGQLLHIAASAALAGAMAAIAIEDFRRFRVPDPWNLFAALAGFLTIALAARSAGSDPLGALASAALGGVLCGGALFMVREAFLRLRGVDGLGLGDVKLAATGGIWLGWQAFPYAVMLAALSALVYVALSRRRNGAWPRQRKIPFALHLAPAIWACWYFWELSPFGAPRMGLALY
jgi:leader peptidase (prepilin peptidase)/N-methyltransferase